MAGNPVGVLLDLDDTLVLTAELAALRDARRWTAVYAGFSRTQLPPGTRDFIAELGTRARMGVVTSAPRTYAELLLAHHSLALPVLVAYHDVSRRKPHPDPLLAAAELLGLAPTQCAHIGDRDLDDVAARGAGMDSILVDWTNRVAGRAHSWPDVLRALWPTEAIGHRRGATR